MTCKFTKHCKFDDPQAVSFSVDSRDVLGFNSAFVCDMEGTVVGCEGTFRDSRYKQQI
jgi:hypothetical protein